jgi:nucleotide-binding universal stress UspA family protein
MSGFGPIVVGTDGSDTAKVAVGKAGELAARVGARVHVVSATYRARGVAEGGSGDGDGVPDPTLARVLSEAAVSLGGLGIEVETHARVGEPADAILEIAEEQQAKLIVVGNRGMSGGRRWLLGDVPNKIAHHAPCNVLILRTSEHSERATVILAGLAFTSLGAVAIGEMVRMWRRGSKEAGRQSLVVAVKGYRSGTAGERALLNLLAAFVVTSAITRRSTWVLRRRGRFGPIREIVHGPRHIHHFVPGIMLAFASGGVAVVTSNRRLQERMAFPLGIGVALTLDEWALLLELNDVYWSEEGIVSVQVTLGTTALLAALTLALRLLQRGERRVV